MSNDQNSAWGGRFQEATNAAVEAMNASVAFDKALAIEDIAGSLAHARMLRAQGIIKDTEQRAIEFRRIQVQRKAEDFLRHYTKGQNLVKVVGNKRYHRRVYLDTGRK